MDQFARTQLLLGRAGIERLHASRVAIFGVGGVGGFAAEALVRSGVGAVELFDDDRICLTNLNRQIIALRSTIGQYKVDVMAARLLDINPKAEVITHRVFYMPDTAGSIDLTAFDYVIDAVDTVTAKLELAERCTRLGVPIISAMGAGNKLDPAQLRIAPIEKTHTCPLARVMRTECRKRHIKGLKVAFSTEPPVPTEETEDISCRSHCVCPPGTARKCTIRRDIPGSTAFVPSSMGLLIASEVVRDLLNPHGTAPAKTGQGAMPLAQVQGRR